MALLSLLIAACSTLDEPSVFEQTTKGLISAPAPARSEKPRTEHPSPSTRLAGHSEYPGSEEAPLPARRFQGARASGDGFDFNFDNAELGQIVAVILGDTLKIPYVLDPAVKGRVTISAGRAATRAELLATLETVLQMNAASMLKEGERYRIVPTSAIETGGAIPVTYVDEAREVGPGYGITAMPLRHISSTEMSRLLAGFVARPHELRADVIRNVLFIRGTGAERNSLADIAKTLDVDWLKGQSAGIYRLVNAGPEEIIAELETVFRSKQGENGQEMIRLLPIKRLNAVLALSPRANMLEQVREWVRRLDKTDPLAESVFVYRVEHAKARALAGLLARIYGTARGSGSGGDGAREIAPDRQLSITVADSVAPTGVSRGLEVPPPPPAPTTGSAGTGLAGNGAGASAAPSPGALAQPAGQGGAPAPGGVHIVPDEKSNKLLIRASLRDYKKIVQILARLDRPATQVLINATLAEVRLNKNLRYGVQAFLKQSNKAPQGVIGFSNGDAFEISPVVPGLNFMVGLPSAPKLILDALSAQTSVRLVSSPSVVVVDNETATLQVGDDVPIATRQAVSVNNPDAPIVNSIEFRKTGVILKVTPRVNSDGLVTMEIEQEISAVANNTTQGDTGTLTPTISQRKIVSTISVYNGQMVVLGGLVTEQVDKLKNGVPILEKVPIVGDLVGKTDDAGKRVELVVFIQPHVIRDAADAPLIADELRERLNSLAPDDRRRHNVLQFKSRRDNVPYDPNAHPLHAPQDEPPKDTWRTSRSR